MSDTGNGATIAFATSGFTAKYQEIGGMNESIPVLPYSGLSTTGHEEFCPGDLIATDGVTCRFYWPANGVRPPIGTVETVTITLPAPPGYTNGATLSGSAFISGRSASPTLQNNALQEGEYTLQFDGITGPTFTVPS